MIDMSKLTADGAIFDAQELGLMVARDCGVSVHIAGKHGQSARHIYTSHPFLFLIVTYFFIFVRLHTRFKSPAPIQVTLSRAPEYETSV